MNAILRTRLTPVWLLLVVATVAGSLIRQEYLDSQLVVTIVLAITMLKVWLVIMEFMELRLAAWPYRLVANAWMLIVWALLCAMPFLVGEHAIFN